MPLGRVGVWRGRREVLWGRIHRSRGACWERDRVDLAGLVQRDVGGRGGGAELELDGLVW